MLLYIDVKSSLVEGPLNKQPINLDEHSVSSGDSAEKKQEQEQSCDDHIDV